MKLKRLTAVLLTCITLFVCVFAVSGCNPKKQVEYRIDFNAELVPNTLNAQFLEETVLDERYSFNPEYTRRWPYSKYIIIDTKEMADEVYDDYSDIDFTKEMLVLYIYTNIAEVGRSLEDVHIEDDALRITVISYSEKNDGKTLYWNDGETLYWQNFTIKMDKIDPKPIILLTHKRTKLEDNTDNSGGSES